MNKSDIKKLDTLFSKYIRIKFSKNGYCECYTCGRQYEIAKIQCGHFWSRKHQSVRWNEDNARPQCYGCNVGSYGRQYEFGLKLEAEIGTERFEELARLKNLSSKQIYLSLDDLIKKFSEGVLPQ